MKKIFFDTEFTGLNQNTTLVSIGMVSDCGKTFYAEFTDYDESQVDEWIKTYVIDKLLFNNFSYEDISISDNMESYEIKGNTEFVKEHMEMWISQFEKVEMWSDCLSYDWVLFCQIFGGAFKIPENVFYIPFDISTLFRMKGVNPDISREEFAKIAVTDELVFKHNSLWDARIIRKCYYELISIP